MKSQYTPLLKFCVVAGAILVPAIYGSAIYGSNGGDLAGAIVAATTYGLGMGLGVGFIAYPLLSFAGKQLERALQINPD
jgi:hypothetical protein